MSFHAYKNNLRNEFSMEVGYNRSYADGTANSETANSPKMPFKGSFDGSGDSQLDVYNIFI